MGDGFRTSFAYNVEIPIVEPVYLLMSTRALPRPRITGPDLPCELARRRRPAGGAGRAALGYEFVERALFERALTHRSFADHNERLDSWATRC